MEPLFQPCFLDEILIHRPANNKEWCDNLIEESEIRLFSPTSSASQQAD